MPWRAVSDEDRVREVRSRGLYREVNSGPTLHRSRARGTPDSSLSVRRELAVPHRKIHKMRHDIFLVNSHPCISSPPLQIERSFLIDHHI